MGEGGIVDKLIGNDELDALETRETAAAGKGTGTADTIATVLAMDAGRHDPHLSSKAAEYLDRQRELTVLTIQHFEHERRLAVRAANLKAIADRFRIALQVVLSFIPLFIVAGIAFLFYGAVTSHSVVVDVFQTPASLAPSGITGQVVANGLLDQLQKLQGDTRSLAGTSMLATKSAWSTEVKIEVPETGVSLGEIDRLLREHLGHDVHIDGDLTQTPEGGIALTVRGDAVPANTFDGSASDLTRLTKQAAEYIYGRSQPYEYMNYLQDNHRDAEALEFVPGAFQRAQDNVLRAHLANGWGNSLMDLNRPAEAVVKHRLAMSLLPYYWTPWGNEIATLAGSAGEEASWREAKAMLAAVDAAPKKQRPHLASLQNPALILWDMPLYLAAGLEDASENNGAGTAVATDQPSIAQAYAFTHNMSAADHYLALSDPSAPETHIAADQIAILKAIENNDPASAAADADALWKVWLANPQLEAGDDTPCAAAIALGMAGRTADADIIFKRLGPWSRCTAARGQILEHQGDLAGAEAAWADGMVHSPDLPFDYMARGLSEEARGDVRSAETDFVRATVNAPHFADPFKLYGDLLAREGRWKDALAAYNHALKYAPNWPALHQKHDAAARRL